MKTNNLYRKGTWQEVLNACRNTVGKPPLDKDPSSKFKKGILLAEHSPIRALVYRWEWIGIKSWIATHFSRHKWECYIKSQRTDRTGIDRDQLPQGALVDFIGEANAQHLIDTMRKRLCSQAAKETRMYAESLKAEIRHIDPELYDVLVPECIYRGGCPEMYPCSRYKDFSNWVEVCYGEDFAHMPIRRRYELYNEFEYEMKGDDENVSDA